MFQVLEEREGNVLGVEIRDEHTKEDKEDVEELKKIFEGSIAEGHDRVNVPFKIDKPATQLGYFTSIFRRETLEGDKRSVFCDSPEYQEKQHEKTKGRSKQSAKRNAQKKRAGNACMVCGRDKGANRFYCKRCHSRLSTEYGFEEYSINSQI